MKPDIIPLIERDEKLSIVPIDGEDNKEDDLVVLPKFTPKFKPIAYDKMVKQSESKSGDPQFSPFSSKLDSVLSSPQGGSGVSLSRNKLHNAVVFLKPQASRVSVQYLITSTLEENGVRILTKGKYTHSELAKMQIIDRQFADIENYATIIKITDIVLNERELSFFRETMAAFWPDILSQDLVKNAGAVATYLGVSPEQLYQMWMKAGPQVKLRSGLHCARFNENVSDDPSIKEKLQTPLYVINGFYPHIKESFLKSDQTIHYLVVEWDGMRNSWEKFQKDIIGDSSPNLAVPSSIRGKLYRDWAELGMRTKPNRTENILHFSASAFEGMVERLIWLKGTMIYTDLFGSRLIASNIPANTIQYWLSNPLVDGIHLFDHMLGKDTDDCLAIAINLRSKYF